MDRKPMPFREAFPNLKLDERVEKYLDIIVVNRVCVNGSRTRMHVYITATNWIRKSYIYQIEDAIAEQIFGHVEMEVKIIERFELSVAYTPAKFYDVYRTSMLLELKQVSPLVRQSFLHADITFPDEHTIRAEMPDTIVNEDRKEAIRDYLEKVFRDRAGFQGISVDIELVEEKKKEKEELFEDVDQKIELKIANVLRRNSRAKEEVKEEKKLPVSEEQKAQRKKFVLNANDPTVIYGKNFDSEPEPIESIGNDPRTVTIRGEVFQAEERETRSGRIIFTVSLTDYTDSLRMKLWFDKEEEEAYTSVFKKGACFIVRGMMDFDPFDRELMIKSVFGIKKIPPFKEERNDTSPEKRVELHCHTKMSDMDAVSSATDIIKQAYHFGMKALAITDHGVVQAFPEAHKALGGKGGIPKDADFKVIYGMEGYLVDDMKNIVTGPLHGNILDDAVVFDVVTTGQSPYNHDMIELSAIKVEKGQLKDEYTTLVNPGRPIPFAMQTETGINDNMVADSPDIGTAVRDFLKFAGDLPLVAYDADMAVNFLMAACKKENIKVTLTDAQIDELVRGVDEEESEEKKQEEEQQKAEENAKEEQRLVELKERVAKAKNHGEELSEEDKAAARAAGMKVTEAEEEAAQEAEMKAAEAELAEKEKAEQEAAEGTAEEKSWPAASDESAAKTVVASAEETVSADKVPEEDSCEKEKIKPIAPEHRREVMEKLGIADHTIDGMTLLRHHTYLDIPAMVRFLIPEMGRIRFKTIVKHLKLNCRDDMRAQPRAEAMALAWTKFQKMMEERDIHTFRELNSCGIVSPERARNLPYYHIIIQAQNVDGKYNLYRLVSESHLHYFKRRPLIPRSLLNEKRKGLILGSACSAGELYKAILAGASDAELARIVEYYDYLEIQPTGNNHFLLEDPRSGIKTEEDLRDINRKIVKLGEEFHKPVCATCDVHFLNPDDAIYRSIIQAGHGFKDPKQPPLYLHTTDEMLKEFSYLGEKKAHEVVIENTNKIADMIENISPIYPDKCPPSIPHSEEDLQKMCYDKAHRWYGDPLPDIVKARLDKELTSIIKNGYAVMYIIAQKLVKKSNEDGYLVGSRGSVGSSFVATMADITEVNPLRPHYRCTNPDCLYSDFDSEEVMQAHMDGICGCDMPDKVCPKCGQPMTKDGFDIPFETFLGFAGNKEPDIDLNFSGDEQNVAQQYTEVIFGKGQTFKAGTIGTVADKTAYGYAMHYFEDKGISKRSCELERLSQGCVGVRRTTGQHPGGVVVLPKGMDINWFTPVQHPANDVNSPFITTHFDYHSIDSNLLKLDILGHDDPTIIRMLQDLTGTDPHDVPLDDKGVLSLFSGTEALGITPEDIDGCELGTLGVPEFGTQFVMGMLKQTHPKTFSELIRISGLSHGTDVWLNNAQYYIEKGYCTLPTAICCRDDIMVYLINKGLDNEHAFKIMESVRKGRGLTEEQKKEMKDHGVEDWYLESCLKIKYMFPKAHAAAYVMNAFRIAYYKINYPLAYYAAYFSIRLKTFDYETMCQGREKLEYYADKIKKNPQPSAHETAMLDDMRLVREMYARGFEFCKLDIYQASAKRLKIVDGKLMPRLNCIAGLGDAQAEAIEREAKKGPFLSKDDFRDRTKVSKTIIDLMDEYGILGDIPESNQISLFDLVEK